MVERANMLRIESTIQKKYQLVDLRMYVRTGALESQNFNMIF